MFLAWINKLHSGLLHPLFNFTLLLVLYNGIDVTGRANQQPKPPDQLTHTIFDQATLLKTGHQISSTEVSCELPGPHLISNFTAFVSLTRNYSHVSFLDNVRLSQGGLDSMGVQHPTLLACTIPKNGS